MLTSKPPSRVVLLSMLPRKGVDTPLPLSTSQQALSTLSHFLSTQFLLGGGLSMLYPCLSMLIYGLSMVCAVSEASAPIIASPAMTPARRNMRTPPHPRYLSSSASGFTTESTDSDSSAWFRAPTDDSADETADAEIHVIPVVASPWSSSARDPPHKRRATMLTDRRDLKRDRHSPKHPTSADDDIDTPTTQSSDGVRRRRHRTARVRTDDATPPVTPSPACGSSSRHHPTGLAAPVWDRSGAGASASISAPIETSAAPASAARSPGPPATPRRSERVRHPTEHLGMARGVTSKSLHRRDDSSSAWEEDFSDTDDGREKDFSDGDCTS